jgi:hypothetical protein
MKYNYTYPATFIALGLFMGYRSGFNSAKEMSRDQLFTSTALAWLTPALLYGLLLILLAMAADHMRRKEQNTDDKKGDPTSGNLPDR